MKYFHSLFFIQLLFLFACQPATLNISEKVNKYFKEVLNEKTNEPTYYIILAPTACISCFYPYMEYFFQFVENRKFKVITNEMNMLSIKEHYLKNKFDFIIPQDEELFSKQAFLKSQFCLVYMKENEIKKFLIVDSKNIFELKKYLTEY